MRNLGEIVHGFLMFHVILPPGSIHTAFVLIWASSGRIYTSIYLYQQLVLQQ